MPRPFEQWTVLPHGQLQALEDNILTVVGELKMPLGEIPRRMTIVRLADGGLVIFNAIALDEQEMAAVERFGPPTWLIVPSDIHRMDAKTWKERYPKLTVVTPPGAREKVEKILPVDATAVDFADRNVELISVPGCDGHEAALEIRTLAGTTLVVNDLIWNLEDRPGFGGWIYHALGMTGGPPHLPGIIETRTVKDRDALRNQLLRWAALPDLNRILVSHGGVLTKDPRALLKQMADQLLTH